MLYYKLQEHKSVKRLYMSLWQVCYKSTDKTTNNIHNTPEVCYEVILHH